MGAIDPTGLSYGEFYPGGPKDFGQPVSSLSPVALQNFNSYVSTNPLNLGNPASPYYELTGGDFVASALNFTDTSSAFDGSENAASSISNLRILSSNVRIGGGESDLMYAAANDGAYNINLLEHELAGGHTIRLHVAKTLAFLRNRVYSDDDVSIASSFYSLRRATSLINMTLNENAAAVDAMMARPGEAWLRGRPVIRLSVFSRL